ncbi:MAG: universal stress protein [Desulfobacteraceae bacterium]|nr:universal stress protein [Desulfobacteraceae bacterium]
MDNPRILLPYNFSITDKKGLNFLISTYAHRTDLLITLFYAYTPLPELDVRSNPELLKMMEGVTYLSTELNEKEKGLQDARLMLVENGIHETCVDYYFKKKIRSTSDEIIDAVKNRGYNVLVLSGKPGRRTQFFTRAIHTKVLSVLNKVTVCIAI